MREARLFHADELARNLAQRLLDSNLTIATAESCTGGGIGEVFTRLPGSSAWYLGGVIAYSNALKSALLNVPAEVINQHGAVSEQVAELMAQGAAKITKSSVAVSTSGIAGPDGGSAEKPVGTVCFGWVVNEQTFVQTRHFGGNRQEVREKSVSYAISRLLELL